MSRRNLETDPRLAAANKLHNVGDLFIRQPHVLELHNIRGPQGPFIPLGRVYTRTLTRRLYYQRRISYTDEVSNFRREVIKGRRCAYTSGQGQSFGPRHSQSSKCKPGTRRKASWYIARSDHPKRKAWTPRQYASPQETTRKRGHTWSVC